MTQKQHQPATQRTIRGTDDRSLCMSLVLGLVAVATSASTLMKQAPFFYAYTLYFKVL
jgi:hypothetical protein